MICLWLACLVSSAEPVSATVSSTIPTHRPQIRQFAFDGKPSTGFEGDRAAKRDDAFVLTLDAPVMVKSVTIATGRPDGTGRVENAELEGSADGVSFQRLASFKGGEAPAMRLDKSLKALRIRSLGDGKAPWLINEIVLDSEPAVTRFRFPVEFFLDVTDAPEMQGWAEKAAKACERAYPMINDELATDGYQPATAIDLKLSSDYKGVAEAAGSRIKGSVAFFKSHPDDIGAMVHETVHVVQRYRGRRNPSWLVEGVADYVRFFKYEPGKAGRLNPKTAKYNASYRVTGAFLAYLVDHYDKAIVLKLNKAMREGSYREELFKEITGKELKQLGEEWQASLK